MIKGSKCDKCDTVFIPERHICSKCRQHTSSVELDPYGVVLSFTTLYVTTENFIPPVVLILVELTKSKTKLLCTGDKNLKIDIGDIVEIEETSDGKYIAKPVLK
ncbi:MAG: zinc ribbon domain-containing protein [Elusimicrobiota bacterium]